MSSIKDSGKRQEFVTGAVRDCQEGKGRFDLIQPGFLFEVARVNEGGAELYGPRNYEQGIPLGRYLDSALRHLLKWAIGYRDEPHLAQAAWNIEKLWWTEGEIADGRLPESLDDGGYRALAARRSLAEATRLAESLDERGAAETEEPDPPALAAARAYFNQGPGTIKDYYAKMAEAGFLFWPAFQATEKLGLVRWKFQNEGWIGNREEVPNGVEVNP